MSDNPIKRFLQSHVALSVLLSSFVFAFFTVALGPPKLLGWLGIGPPQGLGLPEILAVCVTVATLLAAVTALLRDPAFYTAFEKLFARLLFTLSLVALLYVAWRVLLGLAPALQKWSDWVAYGFPALALLAALAAFLSWLWDARRQHPFLILLAEFSEGANREPPRDRSVFVKASQEIRQRVQAISPHIDVRTLAEVVVDENRAAQLGRNTGAGIVGWGWYSLSNRLDDFFVELDFTPIAPPPGYVHPKGESFYHSVANMTRITLVTYVAAHFDCIVHFLLGLERYWVHDHDAAVVSFTSALRAILPGNLQSEHAPLFFYGGNAWYLKGDLG